MVLAVLFMETKVRKNGRLLTEFFNCSNGQIYGVLRSVWMRLRFYLVRHTESQIIEICTFLRCNGYYDLNCHLSNVGYRIL